MKKAPAMAGMTLPQKLRYIWDYYKLPLFAAALLLYILIYVIVRIVSHRDPSFYLCAVNVPLTEEARAMLDPDGTAEIVDGLCLAEDAEGDLHQLVYASRMKILGSIDAEKLDLVLADRQALDAFAEQDFLLPLEDLFADDPAIAPSLVSATVILSDNRTEALLDDSVVYQAVTEERVVAVDLSGTALAASLSSSEGRTQPVYLAIIRNTPRPDAAAACVRQLFAQ